MRGDSAGLQAELKESITTPLVCGGGAPKR